MIALVAALVLASPAAGAPSLPAAAAASLPPAAPSPGALEQREPALTDDQRAALAEVRAAQASGGRALVRAMAEGRVRAEDLWAADAALRAAGAPTVLPAIFDVVFRRASAGDCAAAEAIAALARTAPHPQAGLLSKRIARLVLARPEPILGCWPVYERVLPRAALERTALCDERERALSTYATCTCASHACRDVVRLVRELRCDDPAPSPLAMPACR